MIFLVNQVGDEKVVKCVKTNTNSFEGIPFPCDARKCDSWSTTGYSVTTSPEPWLVVAYRQVQKHFIFALVDPNGVSRNIDYLEYWDAPGFDSFAEYDKAVRELKGDMNELIKVQRGVSKIVWDALRRSDAKGDVILSKHDETLSSINKYINEVKIDKTNFFATFNQVLQMTNDVVEIEAEVSKIIVAEE